jgi:hypothetical protein
LKCKIAGLKLEVMKAKLEEAKAKQLRQQALEELNTIKVETGAMPQAPSATIEEHIIDAAHPSSTKPLPENKPAISAERHSTNLSRPLPWKFAISVVTSADSISSFTPFSLLTAL